MTEQYDALQFPFSMRKMELSRLLLTNDIPDWQNKGFLIAWDNDHIEQIMDDIMDEMAYYDQG